MKDRIRQIIDWTDLSQQDFATMIGVSPASLSSIFTGRTNPTNNHVQAIHRAFPEINVSWLLFGEGAMLNTDSSAGKSGGDTVEVGQSTEGNLSSDSSPIGVMSLEDDRPSAVLAEVPSSPSSGSRRENTSSRAANIQFVENTRNIDRKERRIKEIRVFFDDGTYEAFVPSNGK